MKSARPDYYQALGVERGADAGEIKAAYRRLAFAHHPDRNPGDAGAEEKFKEVSVAYAVLGDEDKREKYDRFGSLAGDLPLGADADLRTVLDFFDAVFGDLFGTARKRPAGQDLRDNARSQNADFHARLHSAAVVRDHPAIAGGRSEAMLIACGAGGHARCRRNGGSTARRRPRGGPTAS